MARLRRARGVVAEKRIDFSLIFGEYVLLSEQPLSQPAADSSPYTGEPYEVPASMCILRIMRQSLQLVKKASQSFAAAAAKNC